MRHFFAVGLIALFASSVLTNGLQAAPIIVDTFDTPAVADIRQTGMPNTGSFPNTSGPGIMGTRAASDTGPGGNFGLFEGIALGAGSLMLGTQNIGVQVDLTYSGFGTVNLSGYSTFDMVFIPIFDLGVGTFNIVLSLTTGSGTLSTSIAPPSGIAPGGGVLSIPLNSLTGPGSLSTVTQITLRLNDSGTPSPAADFTISEIRFTEAVPEPSSFVVAGLFVGLLGGSFLLRRRSMKCAATLAA